MSIKVNDMDLRVLSLFTRGYDKGYYIKEATSALKISSRTALVTLAKLEDLGILESKTEGKNKMYKIRKTNLSQQMFILAEQYKKLQFVQTNAVIGEICERIQETAAAGSIISVFGSHAKGSAKKESDLDIFIAGNHDEKIVREIGKTHGIELNVKGYPARLSGPKMAGDLLLAEVKKDHIIIQGAERFVGEIWRR